MLTDRTVVILETNMNRSNKFDWELFQVFYKRQMWQRPRVFT